MGNRTSTFDHQKLLLECARLYYEVGLSKTQISKKLGHSKMSIGRLLEEARKVGIIKFKITPPTITELESRLKTKFHLRDAKVVVSTSNAHHVDDVLQRDIGKVAADYLESLIASGISKVAISGGPIMFNLIESIEYKKRDIKIFPLAIVPYGPEVADIDCHVLINLLWKKCKGGARAYTTGFSTHRGDSRRAKEILEQAENSDVMIASTGCIRPDSTTLHTVELEKKMTKQPLGVPRDAVGHLNYQFYDFHGNVKLGAKFAVTLSKFQECSKSSNKHIVVLCGCKEVLPVFTAASCGFMNVLITDMRIATELLDQNKATRIFSK